MASTSSYFFSVIFITGTSLRHSWQSVKRVKSYFERLDLFFSLLMDTGTDWMSVVLLLSCWLREDAGQVKFDDGNRLLVCMVSTFVVFLFLTLPYFISCVCMCSNFSISHTHTHTHTQEASFFMSMLREWFVTLTEVISCHHSQNHLNGDGRP